MRQFEAEVRPLTSRTPLTVGKMLIMTPESCLGQGPEIWGQSSENPMASRVQAPACVPGSSKAATAFIVSGGTKVLTRPPGDLPSSNLSTLGSICTAVPLVLDFCMSSYK